MKILMKKYFGISVQFQDSKPLETLAENWTPCLSEFISQDELHNSCTKITTF